MNRLILGFFLGVASVILVASLFSFVSAGWLGDKLGLSPPTTGSQINAHACRADATCETQSLTASNAISSPKISVDQLISSSSTNQIILNSSLYSYWFAVFNGDLMVNSPYKIEANKASIAHLEVTEDLVVEQSPTILVMNGNGNAYVCVDSDGKFYRSQSPCV